MRAAVLLIALVGLSACDTGRQLPTRPAGQGSGDGTCNPGDTQACVCIGGARSSGTQRCEASGTFGACACAAPADAGPDGGPRADSGARPPDGGATDAQEPRRDDAGLGDAETFTDRGVIFRDAEVAQDALQRGRDAEAPPIFPDAEPVFPDAEPAFPDAEPVFPDAAPIFPDAAPIFPDAQPLFPDAAPRPDAGFVDAGTAPCTFDLECPGGRCHNILRQCVPLPPRALCSPCTQDSECGIPPDRCSTISFGGMPVETVCTQACRFNVQCPRGYECSGGQCYPRSGTFRPHTCASVIDMLQRSACSSTGMVDMCGVRSFDDGTCLVGFETCVIGCTTDDDCPAPSLCRDYIVAKFCRP